MLMPSPPLHSISMRGPQDFGAASVSGSSSDDASLYAATADSSSEPEDTRTTFEKWSDFWGFDSRFNDAILSMPSESVSRRTLFIYRAVVLVFFVANFIGDPIYNKWADNMALNSSYLTRWTYAMVNVYFLLSVIAMMRAQEGRPVKFDLLHQLTLLTFEAATALSVVVVTIYWLFLFKGETDIGSLWFNLVVHASTLFFLTIEMWISRMIFVWRHYFWVVGWGVCYLFVNLWYTLSSGKPVYSILTWSSWFSGAVIVGIFAFIVAIFFVCIMVGRFRDRDREIETAPQELGIELQHH